MTEMSKQEFLTQLRKALSGLPQNDIEERIEFYSEMIEDRMEEGLLEGEAVAAVGTVEEIAGQIIAETSLVKIARERIKPKRRRGALEIILLILGSPIWLSLGIAAVAVIFSLYIALWSVIISLWSVFASLAACAFGGVVACVIFAIGGHGTVGLAMLAAGMVCGGLSIFMFLGCKAATKGVVILTKNIARWIKNCFIRKEEV
jgi:uncharacterized membrane protein